MKRFDLFIKLVQLLLQIHCNICNDIHGYLGNEVLAGAVVETRSILISDKLKEKMINNPIEAYLILSHEMRHIWQFVNQPYSYDDYCSGDDSLEEYEIQECEIDANAFACLVVNLVTGKIPKRNTWGIYSYDLIMLRVKELELAFRLRCKNREVKKLVSILKNFN